MNQVFDEASQSVRDLMALSRSAMAEEVAKWSNDRIDREISRWEFWARAGQLPPSGSWHLWLVLAGRGFGKTRMGAEWVRARAMEDGNVRIALVGATIAEARQVMVEGESGLLNLSGQDDVLWEPSLRQLTWSNGATATLYSAARPESLRGPQHHFAWADEIAKWKDGITAWDNLMMGLRLGKAPRAVATTTPRPVALIRRLVAETDVEITKGRTRDNEANLPSSFLAAMDLAYAGTRTGRQELDGELIEDIAGALWTRDLIEQQRVAAAPEMPLPPMKRIVIGVDPPITAHGDACGIIAAGLGVDDRAYVLADHSVTGASPENWARAVASAHEIWAADRIVAEGRNGRSHVARRRYIHACKTGTCQPGKVCKSGTNRGVV